ncbi:MAG: hypothetical protein ACEQSX_12540 [Baekduiaceae bacterium]
MTKKPYRLHPHLRVVQDDRLTHPAVDRELRAREVARKVTQLVVTISALGLSALICLAVAAVASRWGR